MITNVYKLHNVGIYNWLLPKPRHCQLYNIHNTIIMGCRYWRYPNSYNSLSYIVVYYTTKLNLLYSHVTMFIAVYLYIVYIVYTSE